MGIDKKVKIKRLSDELKIPKEKLKEMESLKKMVKELAEKVKKLENVDNIKTSEKELYCRKCSKKYNSMQTLKKHIPRKINVIILMKN